MFGFVVVVAEDCSKGYLATYEEVGILEDCLATNHVSKFNNVFRQKKVVEHTL